MIIARLKKIVKHNLCLLQVKFSVNIHMDLQVVSLLKPFKPFIYHLGLQ